MGEFGRIDRYFKPLARGYAGALGLTDDAALIQVPGGHELVVTTDAMVAGVHFLADDPPADIAAKLLRVNLSDLAAMGAVALGYTLVTALPRDLDEAWLAAFAGGLGADQRRFGVHLIGGDSVSTAGPITLSVTAFGLVPSGRALTRRAPAAAPAAAGGSDDGGIPIFVTGTIGDAALGLLAVLGRLEEEGLEPADRAALVDRLRRPEPRLPLAPGLRDLAVAAIDISDGLIADLGHIAEVSGRAATVQADRVPLSPAARRLVAARPDLLVSVLTGGDDYELLFAAPADRREALAALGRRHGVAITEIGRLDGAGPAGRVAVIDGQGQPLPLTRTGWTHFQP